MELGSGHDPLGKILRWNISFLPVNGGEEWGGSPLKREAAVHRMASRYTKEVKTSKQIPWQLRKMNRKSVPVSGTTKYLVPSLICPCGKSSLEADGGSV